MWTLALRVVAWAIGLFFPAKDERDTERAAGEQLGKAETNAEVSGNELDKAQHAAAAGNAAVVADAGGLRNAKPGDRKWDPDAIDQ